MTPEDALSAAGHELPAPHPVVGSFALTSRVGDLLHVSGHGSFDHGRPVHTGTLEEEADVAAGQAAARAVMLSLLSTIRAEVGSLSAVRRFVKVLVFVNSAPRFAGQHLVANGATDLLTIAFPEAPRPARSAIGVAALPFGFSVEIEAVVELV